MSSGLDTVIAAWALVDRSEQRGRVRATFARRAPNRKWSFAYAADHRAATLDAGDGRNVALVAIDEAWRCDCPASHSSLPCLHVALVARGLTDAIDEASLGEGDAPDPAYAVEISEASEGLWAAARASKQSLERGDGCIRVQSATIRGVDGKLVCDCPMGDMPACLHRILVSQWARGERSARGKSVGAIAGAIGMATPAAAAGAGLRARGGETLAPEEMERFAPLLVRIESLIAELLTFGLQRMSAGTLERTDALIAFAAGITKRDAAPRDAWVGRIVRSLKPLRTLLQQFQEHIVTITELVVLREIAIVHNLVRAMRSNTGALPLAEFAGSVQQEFDPIPALDIQGLGLEVWTAVSGHQGVTAYTLDLRSGRMLTRSESKPAELAERAANSAAGWADQAIAASAFSGTTITLADIARERYLVQGALAAESGRLSGSGKTQASKREKLDLEDPKLRAALLTGLADAQRIAARFVFDPLGRPPASPPIALVPIARMTPTAYDKLRQELSFEIETAGGMTLPCILTYRDVHALWFDNLDRLSRAANPPRALLCRLRLDEQGLTVEPLTAHFKKGAPKHLTYEKLDINTL